MGNAHSVTHIGTRAAYHPDFGSLAAGQIRAAREKQHLDYDAFALMLGDLVGWQVMPAIVQRWEEGATPPGDVVLAAAVVAGDDPGAASRIAGHLLAMVPHSFTAEALAGPWVTSYQFGHGTELRCHADIAQVTADSDRHVRVANHPPEPRSEGRAIPFRNVIEAELACRHLVGQWRNTSDHRYFGSLQLAVMPGETVMQGFYAGVGSDIEVSTGCWKWVRLEPVPDGELAGVTLREPSALYDLVMKRTPYDPLLTLADVREDT